VTLRPSLLTGLLGLTLLYVVLNATGLLLLRSALKGTADASLQSAILAPRTIIGGLFYACSFLTFIFSLRHHSLTVVFPIFSGSSYAVVIASAWAVFGESISAIQLAGLVAIGSGLVLVQLR
jgi:multidrug transporter EmrE-like cation transporter